MKAEADITEARVAGQRTKHTEYKTRNTARKHGEKCLRCAGVRCADMEVEMRMRMGQGLNMDLKAKSS
jgi:hypothetical protein